ncbi:hypothetical protein KKF25_02095, partial [Patescibacteria group bacterium]|nr:hypothetical protein [Patescibacteria group bacterium]
MINAASLNPRQKIYLTALIWLAILGALILWVLMPLVSQIQGDGSELARKKQEMELFYQDWEALAKSQKNYQVMANELNALPAILPANEALKFIVLIEKFAQVTNNQQTVAVVDASQPDKTQKGTIDLQINLRGNFPDLVKFLIYLENAPYYSYLKSLQAQR